MNQQNFKRNTSQAQIINQQQQKLNFQLEQEQQQIQQAKTLYQTLQRGEQSVNVILKRFDDKELKKIYKNHQNEEFNQIYEEMQKEKENLTIDKADEFYRNTFLKVLNDQNNEQQQKNHCPFNNCKFHRKLGGRSDLQFQQHIYDYHPENFENYLYIVQQYYSEEKKLNVYRVCCNYYNKNIRNFWKQKIKGPNQKKKSPSQKKEDKLNQKQKQKKNNQQQQEQQQLDKEEEQQQQQQVECEEEEKLEQNSNFVEEFGQSQSLETVLSFQNIFQNYMQNGSALSIKVRMRGKIFSRTQVDQISMLW